MTIQTEKEAFWYLPENQTPQMQEGLKQLREHLKAQGPDVLLPAHSDDVTLLRFLKARQWNVENAAAMYTNMIKWRKEHKVDEIYDSYSFPELKDLLPHYPHFYHKTDKYGRPVYVVLLGTTDCAKMLNVTTLERMLDYHVYTWERLERQLMPACSELKGHPITTCTVILDLNGVSMKNFNLTTKRLLTAITKIDQDFYPEHLGTMFIINTPMIFTAIWSVVNPLLEERTRKKIMVLGHNYHDTMTQLIPQENLLTIFGGSSVCRDHVHSDGPWSGSATFNRKPWFPHGSPDEQQQQQQQPQEPAQQQQGAGKALPAVEDVVITATAAGLAQSKLEAGASFNHQGSGASSMISAGELASSSPPPIVAPSPLVPAVAPAAAAVAQ